MSQPITSDEVTSLETIKAMVRFAAEQNVPFMMGPVTTLELVRRIEVAEARVKELEAVLAAVVGYCGIPKGESLERHPDVLQVLREANYPCSPAEYHAAMAVIDDKFRNMDKPYEEWSDQEKADLEEAAQVVETYDNVHNQIVSCEE